MDGSEIREKVKLKKPTRKFPAFTKISHHVNTWHIYYHTKKTDL